jgi:glycosyltransferase involved in cell wall biosynthesis
MGNTQAVFFESFLCLFLCLSSFHTCLWQNLRNFALGMRVLIVNTSERTGGAAIAANRLMEALKNNGVKAKMLVRDKQTDRMTVSAIPSSWLLPLKFIWERLCIFMANGFRRRNLFQVDIANTGTDITQLYEFEQSDIIHLHWVNQGFLSMKNLDKIIHSGKPVVITLHDMWYFTGICHYSGDCTKYQNCCHKCELLTNGGIGSDPAIKVYEQKRRMYKGAKLAFVGCSKWMANLANKSALTEGQFVTNVPNAINTHVFRPLDRDEVRKKWRLPQDKQLILFGAQRITDERKGFRFLAEACQIIASKDPELKNKLGVVVLGGDSKKVKDTIPLDVYPVDYVSNEHDIVEIYNAVNLFVTPSLQDNLPNTIVEAMTCGTPCVGFRIGGIPEMIDHKKNGYVAEYKNAQDFAEGIRWCLDKENYGTLCTESRSKAVNTYSEDRIARRYTEIYEMLLGL